MVAPRIKVQPDDLPRVTAMAAAGLNQAQIADRLGMTEANFRAALVKDKKLLHYYTIGRSEEESALRDSLYEQATDPANPRSVQAAKYLLAARHGYRESDDKGVNVNVNNNTLNLKFPQPVRGRKLEKLIADYAPSATQPEQAPSEGQPTPSLQRGCVVRGRAIFVNYQKPPE